MKKKSSTLSPALLEKFAEILPANAILRGEQAVPYGTDRWFAAESPDVALFPKTTQQVSRILSLCTSANVPVTARGAGYGYVGGCVPLHKGVLLSLERMKRIKEISTADFVAVVQPGVITGELQAKAREKGVMYPPDPASLKDCSIGGNIATNAGGPRCLRYGVTRQYILGLEVVLMDGRILRLGGRTHKNKTGFDLVGLFTGSEGLLGVITEATLKLLPLPPFRGAISAGFKDIPAAAAAVQAVFRNGFLPAALEIADDFTLGAARKFRPDADFPPGDAHLLLEVDGQETSVRSELRALRGILKECGSLRVDVAHGESGCEKIWGIRRVFSQSLRATGLRKLNEDVVVPRGRLVDLVRFARRLSRRTGFPIACFGHSGDGNIHTNIMVADWADPTVRARAQEALDQLFAQVLAWGGSITGEHGVGIAKLPWWEKALSPEVRAVHREIKRALDPKDLLNPGKFA